jgi:hypothetical protein
MSARSVLITCASLLLYPIAILAQRQCEEISRSSAPEARQGIAVDGDHFYAVGTCEIGKYNKKTGELVARWQGEDDGQIIHLDSGVIIDGKLYCAHSNYPGVPMTSSVEIWDANSLQHVATHSFGILRGSCTWVDRHLGFWWAAFAHYDKLKAQTYRGTEYSCLIQFDDNWREIQSWTFPDSIIDLFRPMSNSGGAWGPDGMLYCTGHDRPELYIFSLPKAGSILELNAIVPFAGKGQGIAWDPTEPGLLYGIDKDKRKVIISRLR